MNNAPTRPVLYELELALASSRTSDRGGPAAVIVEQLLAGFFFTPGRRSQGSRAGMQSGFLREMHVHACESGPSARLDSRHTSLCFGPRLWLMSPDPALWKARPPWSTDAPDPLRPPPTRTSRSVYNEDMFPTRSLDFKCALAYYCGEDYTNHSVLAQS